jgi:hypothetical protein
MSSPHSSPPVRSSSARGKGGTISTCTTQPSVLSGLLYPSLPAQVLGSLVAGIATLSASTALADVTPVDLFDDRKAKKAGWDIIDDARDLDLPQAERDGLSQFRGDLSATKARYKEAARRINKDVGSYIEKQYWCVPGMHRCCFNGCRHVARIVQSLVCMGFVAR